MTIATGDAIQKFGAQSEITNGSRSIVAGAFSVIGDVLQYSNADDAPEAHMVMIATLAGALTDSGSIGIYGRRIDVQSTNDENVPTLSSPYEFLGSFPCGVGDASQDRTARITLSGAYSGQFWEFYFKNNTPQDLTSFRVWITPVTTGPKV